MTQVCEDLVIVSDDVEIVRRHRARVIPNKGQRVELNEVNQVEVRGEVMGRGVKALVIGGELPPIVERGARSRVKVRGLCVKMAFEI